MRDLDCRWICCDEHFKYSECLLKKAYIDKMYEKFEELGLPHPFFSSQMPCGCNHDESCPFENARDSKSGTKTYDAEIDEKEAEKRAVDVIAQKSNDDIKDVYKNCALSWMRSKLKSLKTEINDLKTEIDYLQKAVEDMQT